MKRRSEDRFCEESSPGNLVIDKKSPALQAPGNCSRDAERWNRSRARFLSPFFSQSCSFLTVAVRAFLITGRTYSISVEALQRRFFSFFSLPARCAAGLGCRKMFVRASSLD
jgi:hypothetical protein